MKGLVVRIHGLSLGMAKGYELRQAIARFRESGKKAYAFLESAENADYLVATAADEIVMPESGWLMIKGLAAEVTFYKSLFDKLGVKADWMQVGEFKSYGEPFTRTADEPGLPRGDRLAPGRHLRHDGRGDRQAAGDRRRPTPRRSSTAGRTARRRRRRPGLINRIGYADSIEDAVARSIGVASIKLDPKYGKKAETVDLSGFAGFMKMIQMLSGEGPKKAESTAPEDRPDLRLGGDRDRQVDVARSWARRPWARRRVIKHLREAEKDKTVKAIVLRVDSPGGSALASDLIWREVVRIEKPIVASMSDVAASGGYYISMGADKIFAEPGHPHRLDRRDRRQVRRRRADGEARRDDRHRHRRQERDDLLDQPAPSPRPSRPP